MTIQSGRSDSGRLRNFNAMSDEKFEREAAIIEQENNDPEALAAIQASREKRNA